MGGGVSMILLFLIYFTAGQGSLGFKGSSTLGTIDLESS
jgi:hypothetical protein